MTGPRVLVVGEATVDLTLCSARMPGKEELLTLPGYELSAGGAGLNTAVALAALGIKVTLVTRVGHDAGGLLVRELLRARSIDAGRVVEDTSRRTCLSLIHLFEDGEIGLLHHEGASSALSRDDIPKEAIRGCEIVHLAGAMLLPKLDGEPAARLMRAAQALGRTTSLGTSRNTARAGTLKPVLAHLDRIFLNCREALEVTGCADFPSAADWLCAQGVGQAVITLGREGCFVAGSEFTGKVEALPEQAMDTTGCGDAFVAGFLYGVASGLSPEACAVWGNALGACCARTAGTVVGPLAAKEIEAAMRRL